MKNEHALTYNESLDGIGIAVLETAAVAGAVALGAWAKVYVPFTPVPISLQTFAVLVAALTVSTPRATAGMLLYIALGMAGAPILVGPFGPTFGYLLGFAVTPYIVKRLVHPAYSITAATLVIYVLGASWLSLWMGMSFSKAVLVGVAPFILGDILKGVAAYRVARWIRS